MITSIRRSVLHAGLLGCLTLGLSACDATVELVKAPFDATTAVSNGTTQGASELTQPTKEFTSSTTPGSRVGSEDLIRAKQRVHTFAAYNFNNLQHDIAQGRGEYLNSLLTLAKIPHANHSQALRDLQQRYVTLYPGDQSPAELTQRLVDVVWLAPLGTHTE
ncbi:hypothetical protein YTPLAS72_00560 [Nitrospira sp.]|nr:hypothetical protein YTPLAS72_00560 [Nitrospira sp.]